MCRIGFFSEHPVYVDKVHIILIRKISMQSDIDRMFLR